MVVRVASVTLTEPGALGGVVSLVNSALIEVMGPTANMQLDCVRVQTPFQPSNVEPLSGLALSVIAFPYPNWAEHCDPQSIFEAVT